MRLEKVNENQIRCILTKEDLEIRQIKVSELAYGSMKAKMLFKDVMQQANYEFGFEAENIPLMIEAIPMNTGCVVFIITKVSNPEELDTRFSRFAPSVIDNEDGSDNDDADSAYPEGDDDAHIEIVGQDAINGIMGNFADESGVFDLFKKIASKSASAAKSAEASDKDSKFSPIRMYCFEDLNGVGRACKVLNRFYKGKSSLYKNPDDGMFYLVLDRGDYDKKEFLKVSNMMLEYSSYIKTNAASLAFVEEHYQKLIKQNAVENMAGF